MHSDLYCFALVDVWVVSHVRTNIRNVECCERFELADVDQYTMMKSECYQYRILAVP